ncbi:phosphate ABC transporter substrate-binding protein PstS [Thermobifida halotolerans]|uniref:Phosphate-binding protein n=1 Tax=Thermobifida halotolerans TaxID=483545 RepID=A0AA97LZF9_9ACTN|nr:phosphate ABC transporter substrate-binding protein PstS [Thermobifida halotolerans]UOE20784.1 phosphate ABC transporter substrate-binding protein PstS [Thermobifida halotolerans]
MSLANHRTGSVIALLGALVLAAGCGSDTAVRGGEQIPVPDDLECFGGTISGAGSSAQELAMQVWIAGYQTACVDSRVYYDAIGSGGGRSQFIDGAVDFAGSDAAMDAEEMEEARQRCDGFDVIHIPAYVVPIAVAFNLEGVDSLNLTPSTLARLFTGDITRWNDPAIAETNPGVDLPDQPVIPVSRSDESGTTENFTSYLAAAAGEDWPYEPDGQWPVPPVEAGQGNSGVAQAVRSGQGTIGYMEASHAEDMATVRIGEEGDFVELSPESAARIVAVSPHREGGGPHDHALDLDYTATGTDAYPIVLVSYEIACLSYDDETAAAGVKAFLGYLLSDEGQQAASAESGSAPLAPEMRARLLESVDAIGTH